MTIARNTSHWVAASAWPFLLLLSLAGCGEEEDGKGAAVSVPPPVDACSLLSREELESVFGDPFPDPPKSARYGDETFWTATCNWFADATNNSVTLLVRPNNLSPDPARAYEIYASELKEEPMAAGNLASVEDLGVPAGWDRDTRQLTFFQDGYLYILSGGKPGAEGDELLRRLESLAARIPHAP